MKQGEAKPYFRIQLGNVYIAENILIMKNIKDSRKSCGNRCGSAPEVIQELHYLSAVLFWKNKKQFPEENNWTWVKRPVLINLAEDKIAPIWRTTQTCCFFFYKLFTVLFRGNEMIPSYSIPVTRLFRVHFSTRKPLLYGFNKLPFWINWEATHESRMLQAPIKGRKISA